MGKIFEDLEDHEGYAARRLADGTLTPTWTGDSAAFDAYVGACTCGWTGTDQHSPTEASRTAAEVESEHARPRPLLAAAMPARVTELVETSVKRSPSWPTTAPWPPALSPSGSPPGPSASCN